MTDPFDHPARRLWDGHHPPHGYPAGVVAVPTPIAGRAFFPGGFGLWTTGPDRPLPPFPVAGVMVLGHDFHSESGYEASRAAGGERISLPTWRNLVRLLDGAGVDKERCFFTNLYMGLRTSRKTTGVFPGASDAIFAAHCRRFLLRQLALQRPALIIALGVQVPPVLGAMSKDLSAWAEGRGLRHLDTHVPVRRDIAFDGLSDFRTTIVALVHPSLRHASLRHRRYDGSLGSAAESKMLQQALTWAGIATALST